MPYPLKVLSVGEFFKNNTSPSVDDFILRFPCYPDLYEEDLNRALETIQVYVFRCKQEDNDANIRKTLSENNGNTIIFCVNDDEETALFVGYMDPLNKISIASLGKPDDSFMELSLNEPMTKLSRDSIKRLIKHLLEYCSNFNIEMVGLDEQLSPNGLALLSYLRSIHKKHKNQPFIATNYKDLVVAAKALNDCSVGDRIAIVFQNLEADYHKTAIILEKLGENKLRAIHSDSTNTASGYCYWTAHWLSQDLQKENISVESHVMMNPYSESTVYFNRQYDKHRCGVFAYKDAKTLLFLKALPGENQKLQVIQPKNEETVKYPEGASGFYLPAKLLKGVQSRRARKAFLRFSPGAQLLSSKNTKAMSLTEYYDSTPDPLYYSRKISKKFKDVVMNWLTSGDFSTMEFILTQFSARRATKDRIQFLNDTDMLLKQEKETVENTFLPKIE